MDDIRMTQSGASVKAFFAQIPGGNIWPEMRKDTRITFRVSSELKKQIEAIAERESQSVARICEGFLMAGSDVYRKQGGRFLEKYIGRTRTTSTS
jgi:hypothetical protein